MATFLKPSHQSKLVTLRNSIFLHSKLNALYKKVLKTLISAFFESLFEPQQLRNPKTFIPYTTDSVELVD